jgi:hypothetical protein
MIERTTNWLNGAQQARFCDALMQAFRPPDFMRLLGRLNVQLYIGAIIDEDQYKTALWHIIDQANRNEWAARLLGAALEENPESRPLLTFARSMGVGSSATVDAHDLEKAIRSSSSLQDIGTFMEALAKIERAVCQVAVPGGGGTGTLVGPDLVLTNHHVIADLQKAPGGGDGVFCHFDFKRAPDARLVHPPTRVPLDSDWLVCWSEHSERDLRPELGDPEESRLDFALLKLQTAHGSEPFGEQKVGITATGQQTVRGWLPLKAADPAPNPGDTLFVVQHPQKPGLPDQEPIQLSIGTVLSGSPANRLRHDATTYPGASGALCFNEQLKPVALHHLGDPNEIHHGGPKYNQAILLQPICKQIEKPTDESKS